MKKIILVFLMGILPCGLAIAKDYSVDTSHSQIEFKIKHLSVSNVSGNFGKFEGSVSIDNNKLTALNGEVDISSINTNNEGRDAHIQDPEYFDTKKFPKATLKLVKMNDNNGTFDLTIKGITKQITLGVEVFGTSKNMKGDEVVGLELNGKINRKDFDIASGTPNVALGEEVTLSIGIEGVSK
ncbi:YceI family protein [Helicobacter sp. MIT 99-5507]|uniref:YceI family protein n=1 Tax=Helicobacter sp. MIT 99-5507 TaxID=152489 RepID=UPI000E1F4F8D|nr:YceI family protein [Helicobacter sp. MIT 99-5507]RDU58082.1 polyisoprenoid-binding protein [Helicobacter sp. MIT 99-5507]